MQGSCLQCVRPSCIWCSVWRQEQHGCNQDRPLQRVPLILDEPESSPGRTFRLRPLPAVAVGVGAAGCCWGAAGCGCGLPVPRPAARRLSTAAACRPWNAGFRTAHTDDDRLQGFRGCVRLSSNDGPLTASSRVTVGGILKDPLGAASVKGAASPKPQGSSVRQRSIEQHHELAGSRPLEVLEVLKLLGAALPS